MSTWLLFLVLGVGTGALYAALAAGVLLIYRGSGVINFALGAMAMFPAVVYAELRTTGTLLLPVVVLPDRVGLGDPMGFWPAALIAMVVGLIVSGVAYLAVFRPLRHAPPLTLLVATVGLTITLQALASRSFGARTIRTPAILPQGTISLFDRVVPVDRLWLAVMVVLVGFGLTVFYRLSRFGLATRGSATSEKGALLLGFNTTRLGMTNWLIATMIVNAVGIISTSIGGVNPFNYSFYVVPALAAALAARMRSMTVAVATGIAIGSFESLTVHLVGQRHVPNFLLGGFSSLVPFVIIVVALILVGDRLPTRATAVDRSQVEARLAGIRPVVWLPTIGVAAAIFLLGDASMRFALIQTLLVITLLMSIVLMTGFVGQASLAQLSLAGMSAFALAQVSDLPFPIGPAVAIGVTTVIGTLIGVPALRIRGIQFAIVTFAAAVVFDEAVFGSPSLTGQQGLAEVKPPSLFGIDLGMFAGGSYPSWRFGLVQLACVAAVAVLLVNVRRSSVGRRFLALRANERAAAACGINIVRTKLLGAGLASFVAGVAGVMFAYKSVVFNGAGLEAEQGLELFALAYLGGIGSVAGAVIGGVLAPSGLAINVLGSGAPSQNLLLLTGLGLLLVTVRFPGGLAGIKWSKVLDSITRRNPAQHPAQ